MLYLYQSNRLEQLCELFIRMVHAVPLSNPFQSELVMIQSRGIGRWISLNLAQKMGIAANLDFVLPAAYVWRLVQRSIPDLPSVSPFSPPIMLWRLMALLPSLDDAIFEPLIRYQEKGELSRFELAGKIADIFDQYQVFRPDWIRRWEKGEQIGLGDDEVWQAALWKKLAEGSPAQHRVRMLDQLFPALSVQNMPERLSLFGIANLAPMYLALIKRMAELTDVCVFVLNPCAEYWGDIVDVRGQLSLPLEETVWEEGHPLLASLGKQGRDFFDQIIEHVTESRNGFEPPSDEHILARLQRDILLFSPPDASPIWPADDDHSIEIHIAHTPVRELEILKDVLLAHLDIDPTLTPADIAVLTPDIHAYAPYIDAVFGHAVDAPALPYSIADRSVQYEEPLLATFMALLALMDSRFPVDQVMALLDCPALLARFSLAPEHVPLLQQWVRESGIRWGIDAAHKVRLGLLNDSLYTWRWGLDRLLLGSVLPEAMAGEESPVFASLLPAPGVVGEMREPLAALCQFFYTLQTLESQWSLPCTIETWHTRLRDGIDALFVASATEEAAFNVLYEALEALLSETTLAMFQNTVGLSVIRDWFKHRLSVVSSSGFLAGGVTFCAMVPMRAIPFRILCVIGLNAGAYPRDERPVSFDLVAQHPRRGDRSRRFDDRYLFLEAILSARDKLYLSYVGVSAQRGGPLPPSVLISDLIDVLARMSGVSALSQRGVLEKRFTVAHPLQPFSPSYFDGSVPKLSSFDMGYARALAQPSIAPARFVTHDVLSSTVVARTSLRLNHLIRFWHLPCRLWLAETLGIRLKREEDDLPVREPFTVDRQVGYALRQSLVDALLTGRSLLPIEERWLCTGYLPPAMLGEVWLREEMTYCHQFVAALPSIRWENIHSPLSFNLSLGRLNLMGELCRVTENGLIDVVPRPAYATEVIALWLTHLVMCCVAPEKVKLESQLFTVADRYHWGPVPNAQCLLMDWLDYWVQGQARPLPFFPRTSFAYARKLYESQDSHRARVEALSKWSPHFDRLEQFPQKDEPAIALAFRHDAPLEDPLFHEMATRLLFPLFEYRMV